MALTLCSYLIRPLMNIHKAMCIKADGVGKYIELVDYIQLTTDLGTTVTSQLRKKHTFQFHLVAVWLFFS